MSRVRTWLTCAYCGQRLFELTYTFLGFADITIRVCATCDSPEDLDR